VPLFPLPFVPMEAVPDDPPESAPQAAKSKGRRVATAILTVCSTER
jgi:hypothetical protein